VLKKRNTLSKFPFQNVKPEFFMPNDLVKKKVPTKFNFKTTKEVMPHVDKCLFNKSYASLSSFVAILHTQKKNISVKYISFINPSLQNL
jgi:hypothetical protein